MRIFSPALLLTVLAVVTSCDSPGAPLVPADMVAVTANPQAAIAGSAVPESPAVRVITADGEPVPGVAVTFTTRGTGAALVGGTSQTDEEGIARVSSWTLGVAAGEYVVDAAAEVLPGRTISFHASARAGPPARLAVIRMPGTLTASGVPLTPQPIVAVVDMHGNATAAIGVFVTAHVADASVTVAGNTTVTNSSGIATFDRLALSGPAGAHVLEFSSPALAPVAADEATTIVQDGALPCPGAQPLDLPLGGTQRFLIAGGTAPSCLEFARSRNTGQQYLLMFENMPLTGEFDDALFPGATTGYAFDVRLRSIPAAPSAQNMTAAHARAGVAVHDLPEGAAQSWDFGAGPIYEGEPITGDVPEPVLLRNGQRLLLSSAAADPQVGDTVIVRMQGIERLGIGTGNQRAVVRHLSPDLIIAEDVRLGTLARQGGGFNTPLHPDTMRAIADQYAAQSRTQGNMLFEGRFNSAIESPGLGNGRVLAVHSLMYADNIWGYTYPGGYYFVWDYWVSTGGNYASCSQSSNQCLNQRSERNSDNLFMHEIAHMRHTGMLERAGIGPRGNKWLVEGFARFTERLPIAARLLGTPTPSRTGNVRLPYNSGFSNTYFRDDVPTFLNAGSPVVNGYQSSSYVFDYLADQVELAGGNWMEAVRDFVRNAGTHATADAAINRWLPGVTLPMLFTQARVALYLDDIGTDSLPSWTQYHQFQLRLSRPAGSQTANDPRNAWPALIPGTSAALEATLENGAATGYIIDGTSAIGDGFFVIDAPAAPNAVLSITRIR